MKIRHIVSSAVVVIYISSGLAGVAQAEALRIFYFNWAGYGPFFLAQEKGFFAEEGIQVDLINVEETHAAYAGLSAGYVDAVAAVLQDIPFFATPEEVPVCVLAIAYSSGADGIVADKAIQSVADLKGKSIAFEKGSSSHFYLSVVLREAGLDESDIDPVDVPDVDGVTAFLLQEVDAVSTWGAMLIEAEQAPHAHLLTDSSEQPGTIVDCLITTVEQLEARRSDFEALGRAWDAAVDYVMAQPEEAIRIMANRMGGAHGDHESFSATLNHLRLYDEERNRVYFGTPDQPGQIYETAQHAIDVWSGTGTLEHELSASDMIAHGVWAD